MKYKGFINTISTDDFGGFNAIEYADGGLEYYVSVQAVLKWIGEYANLISNGSEIIHVDWESDKPMFMYSTTLSCDLAKCYVRNAYLRNSRGTFNNKSGIPSFKNINTFEDIKYASLNQTLKEEAGTIEDTSIYPQVGNINYIYLSTYHLSQLITKGSDNKDNKITIRKFLQDICDGMNKALGSINDFQVISNVDGIVETLTIIDYQQKRVKGLAAKFKEADRNTTTLQTQGLGTMLTKIQAQSSITPELADMIAIGAQAQNQPVGEEAASFSLLSKGLTDRIYPSKTIGDINLVKQEDKRKEKLESEYDQALSAYAELLENQQPVGGGTFNSVSLKSTEISNLQNIAVELYKACLGMFTETGQTSTAFIPIKINLSLYGISGIKIYQKFKLSNNVLPLSYKGNFEFVVLGISHTVDSSRWETNISALITLADESLKKDGPLKPFSVRADKLKAGSSDSSEFSPGSFIFPGPAATSPTGPDFKTGTTDYALQVNPNKIGSLPTTGNAPVAKDLASRGLQNANLDTGNKNQLVSIVGADRNFKKRYGAYLLHPAAAAAWRNAYNELRLAGLTVQVYSAYRDLQHQRSLGTGTGVAGAGTSPHGWGMALDISPFNRMAKPVTLHGLSKKSTPRGNVDGRTTEFYRKVGEIMAKHDWYNPWRLADNGGSVDEIWHWEYWGPAGFFIK